MIETKTIPAMTPVEVHNYLRQIGTQWTGQGVAMELGCWLGATSVPLLEGLVQVGYDRLFWAFERWIANKEQVEKASKQGVELKLNQDVMPLYLDNVFSVYDKIIVKKGKLPEILDLFNFFTRNTPLVEICIFDAPKTNPTFIECIKALHKHWIPGVTILGLLDYYFYERKDGRTKKQLMAPVEFIESNKGCFTKLEEFKPASPAFFRYEKPLINI